MNQQFLILLEELKKLNFPKDKYAVFGSGPLAIRNIREAHDLDVIVTHDFFQELCNKYPKLVKFKPFHRIDINKIEIVEEWLGDYKAVNNIIKNVDIIDNLPFVKLEHIVEWKIFMSRKKDLEDIKLINNYFKKSVIR